MDELRGWKEIGAYFDVASRTAQRWEREYGMPVHRTGRTRGASVFALRAELDHWRLSPEGERASSDDADTSQANGIGDDQPPPTRKLPRLRPVPAFAVAALLVVVGALWFMRWRPVPRVSTASPATDGRAATEGYAEPVSPAVLVLRVTSPANPAIGNGTIVFHVFDGGMATLGPRNGSRLGLIPDQGRGRGRLGVYEVATRPSGAEAVREIQTTTLPFRSPIHIEQMGLRLDVEWIDTVTPSVLPARSQTSQPPKCCVVCAGLWLCAAQVTADCGSCCGFEGCRQGR